MAQSMSFDDSFAFDQLASGQYESRWPMESNSYKPNDKIAYGGCTLAFAVKVGYATVGDTYRLYSCMGLFLGPAIAGEKLQAKVTAIRDTRTFATRKMDFQVPEKSSLLKYSVVPKMQYTPAENAWDESKMRQYAQEQGTPERTLRFLDTAMSARKKYFEIRSPPQSESSHTLHGMLPHLRTVQTHLSVTDKTSCYYWKTLEPLDTPATNTAALAFLLDAGMPVVPVSFGGINWKNVASATSLDFAIRIFTNDVDAHQWLKREEQTITAGEGRTYQEARVWNEQGNLIASMSEQCLLRAVDSEQAKL